MPNPKRGPGSRDLGALLRRCEQAGLEITMMTNPFRGERWSVTLANLERNVAWHGRGSTARKALRDAITAGALAPTS